MSGSKVHALHHQRTIREVNTYRESAVSRHYRFCNTDLSCTHAGYRTQYTPPAEELSQNEDSLQTGKSSWKRWIGFGQAKCNHFLQGKLNQPGQNGELMLGIVADKVSKADLNRPVVGFKYQVNKLGIDCV